MFTTTVHGEELEEMDRIYQKKFSPTLRLHT